MNLLKRAWLSIRRRLGKFMLFLSCVFLLAVLMSGAFSVQQAITNTDAALRAQLPAVATLVIDVEASQEYFEETGTFPEDTVTPSTIREIGALSYVEAFDYTAWGFNFFSSELNRAFNADLFSHLDLPESGIRDTGSLSYWEETPLEQFTLKGGQHPDILDIEVGLIELRAGRTFTKEEVETLSYVAVVSQDFLSVNNLSLGSILTLDYLIFNEAEGVVSDDHHSEENLLAEQTFELEIIGVFEKLLEPDAESFEVQHYIDFVNRIYVPNVVVESIVDLYMEVLPEIDPEFYAEISAIDNIEEVLGYDNFLFLLYDPMDLVAFADEANDLLPGFWVVEDLSNTYSDISNSMEMMNEIADWLVIGSVFATLVVLGLLILLFLVDREQEVGIYLALGEKKHKILIQFIFEIMIAAIIGMTFALFVGNLMGSHVSQTMIEQDVMRQLEDPERIETFGLLYGMGFRVDMTHEEMLELYEVTLDASTIVLFYAVTLSTVLVTTSVPIWMVVNMKPKEILMSGKIQ